MDFGSLVRARIKIQSHNEALMHQEAAAQYSTMSYRAPELFDVKTELNEKVDIWVSWMIIFFCLIVYLQNTLCKNISFFSKSHWDVLCIPWLTGNHHLSPVLTNKVDQLL
jgi:hypothetical protein